MKTTDFETSHRPSFSFLKDLGALYIKGGWMHALLLS